MKVLAVVVVVALGLGVADPAGADGPVDDSRQAAQHLTFTGQVRVQWVDERGMHTQEVDVEAANGVILVRGPVSLMAHDRDRLVRHAGTGWDVVWSAALGEAPPPAVSAKYDLSYATGPLIAGRTTQAVEIRRGSVLWERVYVDNGTGLILGREQFGPDGRLRRAVSFDRLTGEAADEAGRLPTPTAARLPRDAAGARTGPLAPGALAGGYARVGAYRRSGVVQLFYSDGVYGLSVFEQRGRLEAADLPHGAVAVRVGRSRGWRLAWPGGEIVLWQTGDRVFTVVGEAPIGDVLAAAASLPSAPRPSALAKLRRVCRSVLDAVRPA